MRPSMSPGEDITPTLVSGESTQKYLEQNRAEQE